jgi:hypothetical protein
MFNQDWLNKISHCAAKHTKITETQFSKNFMQNALLLKLSKQGNKFSPA